MPESKCGQVGVFDIHSRESLMTSICPVKKCNVVIIHRTDLIMEDMSGISDKHEKLRRTHPCLGQGCSVNCGALCPFLL